MSSDGIRLKPDSSKFSTIFILETINSPVFRKKAECVSTGSTRKRIGLVELRGLTISVPTYAEQHKIANLLGAIEKNLRGLGSQIKQAETFKQGLLQQMFV